DEAKLSQALNALDAHNVKYLPNFEGALIGWVPSAELKTDIAKRPGFLGFILDELDHMQINAHWPVIDYYGYDDVHYLAETEGLDLFAACQIVLEALQERNAACTVGDTPAAGEF